MEKFRAQRETAWKILLYFGTFIKVGNAGTDDVDGTGDGSQKGVKGW